MAKFTYDDIVIIRKNADPSMRPGSKAWVIGVFQDRTANRFEWLPEGVVYSVEFEDGEAIDVHETALSLFEAE